MGGQPMPGMPMMGGAMGHPGAMGGAHISPSSGNAMPTPHQAAALQGARRGAGVAPGGVPGQQPGAPHGALQEMALQNLRARRGGGLRDQKDMSTPIMMMEKGVNVGSDTDGTGQRRSLAGVTRVKAPSGTPTGATTKTQRGSKKTHIEQALDAVQDAKEAGANPQGDKNKKSGFSR